MFKRTQISTCALLALGGLTVLSTAVQAQEVQRIEITGSAIRRINAEGALPVTTITREEIEKSGAKTVAELLQALPAMQGFTTTSESINGGGGGTTTVSIHALGNAYTLVLLNGRRVAPFNTGSTVNLESIPLSAIERVEVLTDGASALYGSDAIAGVVNFILRKNSTVGEISASVDKVERGGGQQKSVSLTKGFGDLDKDGFNVLASLSIDKQSNLRASQRSFSKSGIIRGIDGQNLGLRLFSSNTVPGTVLLLTPDAQDVSAFYTPYLLANGSCPPLHVVNGATCRFDFASQVELIPESQRSTGLLSGRFKLGRDHEVFAELVLSKFQNKPTYAPPAQPGLLLTQAQFDTHVVPNLGALGLTLADVGLVGSGDPAPTYNLRVFDAGGRRNLYKYDTTHFVLGGEGNALGFDYKTSLTLSKQDFTDKAIGGYLSKNRFDAIIASGAFDPLASTAGQGVAALAPAVLNEVLDKSKSSYNSFNLSVSKALAKLDGGDVMLAAGGEVARQRYVDNPELILQSVGDQIVGGGGGALPFDTTRKSYGLFAEVLVPVTKALEVTGSLRFDNYDAAVNKRIFDAQNNPVAGSREEGKKASSATWKLSTKFQPIRELALRASYGTGFKAPTLANITSPLQDGGVTTGSYECPFAAPDPLAANCNPPDSQYNILAGGNASTGAAALKPEKSKQFTAGLVMEPSRDMSATLDFWKIKLNDQLANIPEQTAFANPATFRSLFVVARDSITGRNQLTLLQTPINISESNYSGIDLTATLRANSDLGRITTRVAGTYMLKADYTLPGLEGFQSSLGKFGVDNNVIFRWKLNGSATLDSGNWSHTFTANYASGYQDHVAVCGDPTLTNAQCTAAGEWLGPEIRTVNPTTGAFGGRVPLTRRVAEYLTMDFQTKYSFSKSLDLTVGVINLAAEDPPFSVQDAGGGNMRGYDGRYADPRGRTWYVKGTFKF
jgi:iron complex outermembrane recepter protein